MQNRATQNKLSAARVTNLVPGPFGALPVGALLAMSGGGELDPLMPIDMRGAGPVIASMKAGFFPFAIGTAAYPTQWRPVSDTTFLSQALSDSFDHLRNTLSNTKGVTLSNSTVTQVQAVMKKLEKSEEDVKEQRENINQFNNLLASGKAVAKGTVDYAKIKATVDRYNESLKAQNKYETKILRVIATLGARLI